MKKNILFITMLALVGMLFTSCSDDSSEGQSRITYYPSIELEGDSYLVWEKGTAYVDPGYTSVMNGEDVSDKVTVSGTVDTSKSGIYKLTYTTMKNEDGFDASTSRTVVVLDSSSAIEGFWHVDGDKSYRDYNGAVAYNRTNLQVLIIDNGDGTLTVDDLLGGWYCQRAGYGDDYALAGKLAIDADGNLSHIESFLIGWDDSATDLTGKYDATANHISWVCEYTDYPFFFHVELDKE